VDIGWYSGKYETKELFFKAVRVDVQVRRIPNILGLIAVQRFHR
jgi:hypothetical protein